MEEVVAIGGRVVGKQRLGEGRRVIYQYLGMGGRGRVRWGGEVNWVIARKRDFYG